MPSNQTTHGIYMDLIELFPVTNFTDAHKNKFIMYLVTVVRRCIRISHNILKMSHDLRNTSTKTHHMMLASVCHKVQEDTSRAGTSVSQSLGRHITCWHQCVTKYRKTHHVLAPVCHKVQEDTSHAGTSVSQSIGRHITCWHQCVPNYRKKHHVLAPVCHKV